MSRSDSIDALIRRARSSIEKLTRDYRAALNDKCVSDELKIDIKEILNHLRSSLDYLARDVHDAFVGGDPSRLYFPIRSSRKDFDQEIAKNYAGLDASAPEVFSLLETIQTYNDPWIGTFNRLNNNNKHEDLEEQARTENRETKVSNNTGTASVSWTSGVTFHGNVRVMGARIDPNAQMPIPNATTKTTITTWVDFRFKDNGESVLPFLKLSIENVDKICADIRQHL